MPSKRDNDVLTRVGPGTPMGQLMRRFWMPARLSEELPEQGGVPARVRLLGEDLVAYRDTNGAVGPVAENCPHRGGVAVLLAERGKRDTVRASRVEVRDLGRVIVRV